MLTVVRCLLFAERCSFVVGGSLLFVAVGYVLCVVRCLMFVVCWC